MGNKKKHRTRQECTRTAKSVARSSLCLLLPLSMALYKGPSSLTAMSKVEDKNFLVFRNDVQKSVERFFGNIVTVDERVLRSVCIWRGRSRGKAKHPRPLHVWAALEQEMPLLCQMRSNNCQEVRSGILNSGQF